METDTMHIGRKISRIRELKGMKQETLAHSMGVSQQAISNLEQSEHVDDDRLDEVSKALGVSAEAIKNFDEEAAINFISTTFNSHDSSTGFAYHSQITINPIEKWIEAIEENKKLYERLLQAEKEKVELIQKFLYKK